jgi:ribosomal protein S18 acetylase RimI-like enzyme
MSSSPADLRPPRDDDFDAMLALMNESQLAAFGEEDITADELRTWLTTPYVVPERDIRLLEADGRLIAYVDVDHSEATGRWWSDVKLARDADANAVLPVLVDWLDERTDGGLLRVWTAAGDTRTIDGFRRLGFSEDRHSYRMEIGLDGEAREPAWPDGIEVRGYTPADERLVYDTNVEVWLDASDPIEETFEEWRHWTTARDGFDPSLWFLAFEGGELVGFSLCREAETDPSAGYVGTLGVRRPWRRRGLGEALLLHSFAAFRERGYTRATLGVDASSPTGATRLYERAGMTVYRDTVFLERPARRG